jgi:hypothetical protein
MSALTRRRDHDRREECWLIYYRDVHVGTIAIRSGIPHNQPQWGWRCGFYPGSDPGECTSGTAATFDQARADISQAWQMFSARRTEADYQAWRDQRDWTERNMPCGSAASAFRRIGSRRNTPLAADGLRTTRMTKWRHARWTSPSAH